jgi:hypothetical protein
VEILLPFFRHELSRWERRPLHPGTVLGPTAHSYYDLHRRIVAVEPPGPPLADGPFRRAATAIARYDVFPPTLGCGELRRPVQVNDVVGLRYHLLPGVDIFFASRVSEVIDDQSGDAWRSGFTYKTLAGHPEVGAETFLVEKNVHNGAVTVSLRAWSQLGYAWMRPLNFLARRWQTGAGRAALDHLEKISAGAGADSSAANVFA